ncbi:hypothetical protein FOZ60_016290 [Perkinsus olseni]|uniref:Uncharacterized protein n=1 Tax=Perkinsus olseni TaxID=32597 RepID=A0A7J6P4M8_PEROL|nr:hypothetical protein FOZ60_016290 [Perkinsus olseni]
MREVLKYAWNYASGRFRPKEGGALNESTVQQEFSWQLELDSNDKWISFGGKNSYAMPSSLGSDVLTKFAEKVIPEKGEPLKLPDMPESLWYLEMEGKDLSMALNRDFTIHHISLPGMSTPWEGMLAAIGHLSQLKKTFSQDKPRRSKDISRVAFGNYLESICLEGHSKIVEPGALTEEGEFTFKVPEGSPFAGVMEILELFARRHIMECLPLLPSLLWCKRGVCDDDVVRVSRIGVLVIGPLAGVCSRNPDACSTARNIFRTYMRHKMKNKDYFSGTSLQCSFAVPDISAPKQTLTLDFTRDLTFHWTPEADARLVKPLIWPVVNESDLLDPSSDDSPEEARDTLCKQTLVGQLKAFRALREEGELKSRPCADGCEGDIRGTGGLFEIREGSELARALEEIHECPDEPVASRKLIGNQRGQPEGSSDSEEEASE